MGDPAGALDLGDKEGEKVADEVVDDEEEIAE